MVKKLFTRAFMLKYSDVDSIDALLDVGGLATNSQDEFFAIPDEEWDAVVNTRTRFGSWQELLIAAANELT